MKEVNKKENVVTDKPRKKPRFYFVEFKTVKGKEKKKFETLLAARNFAKTKLGLNVVLTNKNETVLPL